MSDGLYPSLIFIQPLENSLGLSDVFLKRQPTRAKALNHPRTQEITPFRPPFKIARQVQSTYIYCFISTRKYCDLSLYRLICCCVHFHLVWRWLNGFGTFSVLCSANSPFPKNLPILELLLLFGLQLNCHLR